MKKFLELVTKYVGNSKDVKLSKTNDNFIIDFDISNSETFDGLAKLHKEKFKFVNGKESGILKMVFNKSIIEEV